MLDYQVVIWMRVNFSVDRQEVCQEDKNSMCIVSCWRRLKINTWGHVQVQRPAPNDETLRTILKILTTSKNFPLKIRLDPSKYKSSFTLLMWRCRTFTLINVQCWGLNWWWLLNWTKSSAEPDGNSNVSHYCGITGINPLIGLYSSHWCLMREEWMLKSLLFDFAKFISCVLCSRGISPRVTVCSSVTNRSEQIIHIQYFIEVTTETSWKHFFFFLDVSLFENNYLKKNTHWHYFI